MAGWEYCEIEVNYTPEGAVAKMYALKADGRHVESDGKYGEMLAQMGEIGWELVSVSEVKTRKGDPQLKMFLKRPRI